MAINIKDAEHKLGEKKLEEIAEKEWKLAEMPTEEELAAEEPKSPKARNNPNSRKNLAQYNKKTPAQKKKMVKNLKFVEKDEDFDPEEVLGQFSRLGMIQKMMPAMDVLSNRKEQELYYNYIAYILSDFEVDDLTASDLDDIITLALNRVIEYRLLELSSKNPKMVLEASPTIEKFRKFSEKIKLGLASRRVDRVDVKRKASFSIVNLADELDQRQKADQEARIRKMEEERKSYSAPPRDEEGNLIEDGSQ